VEVSVRFGGAEAWRRGLRRRRHAHNTAEPDVPGRGFDRLALARLPLLERAQDAWASGAGGRHVAGPPCTHDLGRAILS
jgi:hypothetical protein